MRGSAGDKKAPRGQKASRPVSKGAEGSKAGSDCGAQRVTKRLQGGQKASGPVSKGAEDSKGGF